MSTAVQLQSEKVRTLKAAHAPQVEVSAAIEELKRLKAQNEDAKTVLTNSVETKAVPQTQAQRAVAITLEDAEEKIRALKLAHASQTVVSQAVAEFKVLTASRSLDPVAVAAERIRVLKSAHAEPSLVLAAIDDYKKLSATRVVSLPEVPVLSTTPAPSGGSKALHHTILAHSSPSVEALVERVNTLKATGASQEQVAAAVAELSAFKNQKSVDPKVVAEAKIRVLKEARAPQEVVQRAVDEFKSLNNPTEKHDLVHIAKGKSKPSANATPSLVKVPQEKPGPAANTEKSESKEVKISSGTVCVWESENFGDFQARMAVRLSDNKSMVSATGLSPPLTGDTMETKVPANLRAFQERSEIAEKRISELSTLCDNHFKSSADSAELQRLRTESANLMTHNASLRKRLQDNLGGVAISSGKDKKAVQKTVAPSPVVSGGHDEAFSMWQKTLSDKCAKLSSDSAGWPGEYWIEEARKHILAGKRTDLVTITNDPTTGPGRAARFILKQFPPPKFSD
jgi:hypothetical protein